MIPIAFYFPHAVDPDKDYSDLENSGNPGIGGTEFEILLIAQALAERDPELDVAIFLPVKLCLKKSIRQILIPAGEPCAFLMNCCQTQNIRLLIAESRLPAAIAESFRNTSVRLILWAHCFASTDELKCWAANPAIRQLVCVGHEQMEMLRDHDIFAKTSYIFNAVPAPDHCCEAAAHHPWGERPNRVVYLGSLHYMKGFHLLAAAWKDILRAVPDAELHVLGGPPKDAARGPCGIASEKYEKKIVPHLTDDRGRILPSVVFHGNVGREKWDVLFQAKVGVANPSGRSETFCLSLVEMALAGTYVTTLRFPAAKDVSPYPEFLYPRRKDLADSVIRLLKRETPPDVREIYRTVRSKFGPEPVCREWGKLIRMAAGDGAVELTDRQTIHNPDFIKRLRGMNACLRKYLPMLPPLKRKW